MNPIYAEKLNQAVSILNEKNIDMWLIFVRESSIAHDPVIDILIGQNVTWQSAFIICKDGTKTAIVGSIEKENFINLFDDVRGYVQSVKEELQNFIKLKNPSTIAVNFSKNNTLADGLTVGMHQILVEYLTEIGFQDKLVSAEEIITTLKGKKSPFEIELLKDAIKETAIIYDEVTKFMKPGKTEKDVARFMHNIVKEKGFELAWDEDHCPAVFAGPNTQGAHSGPTDRAIEKGFVVSIDFGIKKNGYCSDIQRMWYFLKDGETDAPAEVKKGFEVIRDSIQMAAKEIKPGKQGCEIDDVARNYIVGEGYEEYPHGLGHQVGTQAHDGGGGLFPRWERYGNLPYLPIVEDQIFTIEPRLTVKGFGVATMEEMIVVTKDGCEFISTPQTELKLIK